jgi:hypothetical protein
MNMNKFELSFKSHTSEQYSIASSKTEGVAAASKALKDHDERNFNSTRRKNVHEIGEKIVQDEIGEFLSGQLDVYQFPSGFGP